MAARWTRRSWLQLSGLGSIAGGLAAGVRLAGHESPSTSHVGHSAHGMGTVGRVSTQAFDPSTYLRSWNFSHLPAEERARFYRETPRPDGSLLREYEIHAVDREIEIAPGLF